MTILIEKYKSLWETLGKRICIYDNGQIRYCGFAKEIDDDGSLVIERNEGGHIVVDKVFFGDVSLREIWTKINIKERNLKLLLVKN